MQMIVFKYLHALSKKGECVRPFVCYINTDLELMKSTSLKPNVTVTIYTIYMCHVCWPTNESNLVRVDGLK